MKMTSVTTQGKATQDKKRQDWTVYGEFTALSYIPSQAFLQTPSSDAGHVSDDKSASRTQSHSDVSEYNDRLAADWTECLITIGVGLFLLVASSVALGFSADRITKSVIMLTQQTMTSQPQP